MHSDVDIIKSRTNIVDIVGEYVKLTKAGNSFKACCPFHQENTPSFNVNEEKQMYHCFGCGVGGDVFSFVMEIEGMGFGEAL
jgi:DNA primase